MRTSLLSVLSCSIILISGAALSAGPLDGWWPCGRWSDTKSGHQGPLKAKFRQTDDCHYRVVFTGKFAKVIPFRFATTLNVVGQDGDKVQLAGTSKIMGFFRFTYNAVADEHTFTSQYSSRRWNGEFNLER